MADEIKVGDATVKIIKEDWAQSVDYYRIEIHDDKGTRKFCLRLLMQDPISFEYKITGEDGKIYNITKREIY